MVIGLFYQLPFFTHLDTRLSESLNRYFIPKMEAFRYFWPIGTNPMAFVLLGICFIPNLLNGFVIVFVYIFISAFERIIKIKLDRKRPYQVNSEISLEQPITPHDPSHPSGDAMRVWFLAIVFPWVFYLNWQTTLVTCCVAFFVSLGRIGLGVHYPFDVIGGKGLGIFGAGVTMLLAEIAVSYL